MELLFSVYGPMIFSHEGKYPTEFRVANTFCMCINTCLICIFVLIFYDLTFSKYSFLNISKVSYFSSFSICSTSSNSTSLKGKIGFFKSNRTDLNYYSYFKLDQRLRFILSILPVPKLVRKFYTNWIYFFIVSEESYELLHYL